MSVASEIERIQGAKADIKTAIENKGVIVGSDLLIDDYAEKINQISAGSNNNKYVYYLGTGTSFDLTTLKNNGTLPSWIDLSTLTNNDFVVGISEIPSFTSSTQQKDHWARATYTANALTKTYNSSTGILTISGGGGTLKLQYDEYGWKDGVSQTLNVTRFAYLMVSA